MTVKELQQKRDAIVQKMNAIVNTADEETRSLNDDESKEFESLEKELAEIDKTIEAKRAIENLEISETEDEEEPETRSKETTEEMEYRAFDAYLRSMGRELETRGVDNNMTKGENGAVIPSSIANKIIETVKDICPIFADSEHYNVKGTLTIPYYDESTSQVVCGYADDFEGVDSTAGKFGAITLTGFLGEALTNVGKRLINNAQFDIVNYVVRKVAEAISLFIEKELLIGTPADSSTSPATPAKIEGLSSLAESQIIESAANTAITADELIDVQEQVPDVYQADAYWIMNKKTRTAIRKLKDGQGNYLLQKDSNSRWGYRLFGQDVYTSKNMPEVKAANAGKVAVYYGDMTGLATKISEDIEVEVLRETMAVKHAVQIVGFVELDAKVQNSEKIAGLKLKDA